MTEKKSVARLEMEIDELQDKRRDAENAAKSLNFGCVLMVIAGILIVAVDWFVGGIVFFFALLIAIGNSSSKANAERNLKNIDEHIKINREFIVTAKETGDDFIEVPEFIEEKPTSYKAGKFFADKQNRAVVIVLGVIIVIFIVVSIIGQ